MKGIVIIGFCALYWVWALGCDHKPVEQSVPPPPEVEILSKPASSKSQIIHHCIVTSKENTNTVTCECDALHTKIDTVTGRITLTCKAIRAK